MMRHDFLCVPLLWISLASVIFLADRAGAQPETAPNKSPIETVVVTAEKRSEAVGDVPLSVTVLSGEDLMRDQATRFEDYIDGVPGMNFIETSPTRDQLVIRGITTGADAINGSVAVYVDETPWISEGPFANPAIAPNLDTYDMQRIEILKGPQGTLYGAIALGGLLKYVTNPPDTDSFAASAQVGGSTVNDGGYGYDLHGMVNVPLANDLAARLVGYDNYYPGFIDDPSRGIKNVNGSHVSGGRASLIYQPLENFSVRLNLLYQDISASDQNTVDVSPGSLSSIYGGLTHERFISSPEQLKNELINATETWDAGFAQLLSSTSYAYTPFRSTLDDSGFLGVLFSTHAAAVASAEPVTSFTQELRISSPTDGGPLLWQLGGYFNHELSREYEQIFEVDTDSHQILYNNPTNYGTYRIKPTFEEYAGFANLDYFIASSFDVALGGRISSNNQSYHQQSEGMVSGMTDINTRSSQNVFTWSADARWHWTPEAMLYGRIATGYVPGGPNDVLPGSALPEQYKSSTTTNYEIGTKAQMFDDTVSAEVSLFQIDWTRIQIEALVGNLYGITTGGNARSDGFEWNFGYVPLSGLTLNFSGAYTDAYLEQPLPPPTIGLAGARLPYVPLWSTRVAATYEQPLFGDYSGFFGLDWRYSGPRFADFPDIGPRQHMGGYNMTDLRVGIENTGWAVSLYVKNVGNTIAFSSVSAITSLGGLGPQAATLFTPRTIWLEFSARI
jgi:iron complex outermembrane recepter protein